jgi:hypothetical protein
VVAQDFNTARGVSDDFRLFAVHLLELRNELVLNFLILHSCRLP